MNSNASFNSDGMENQNNPQDPLHQNNNNFIPHQYFSHMPSHLHPMQQQQQQQQQYVQAQQYVPIYGHPQYPPPHLSDPIQVLKNQQSFGGMDTQSFVKTMEYKKEQEISKQYSYKLEMLRLSMQANIPGNMIPQLFSNDSNIFKNNSSLAIDSSGIQDEANYSKSLPHPNSDVVLIDPHKQIRLQTVGTASISDYDEDTNSESSLANSGNLMPPTFKRQHKRTNSPSRIGGLGVKALNKIVSVNESQENSRNNSRISSMNSIQNDMDKPTLFKPTIRSFTNSNKGSVVPSAQNSRVSSIRVSSVQNKDIQNPSNNNPPVGSFKPQHKRFNSLPTALKPSPFLRSFKQTNNSDFSKVDNQTSEALLQLSQERYSRLSEASKHSRKRSYDFSNTMNREQIDLNFVNNQDAPNLEYVLNKKFKFGADAKHQVVFPNTSPDTDFENLSNSQSRTVSDCSVTGNTNKQAANKFLSSQAETAETKNNNQGDGGVDHDTTIEEEEDINNTSNNEVESSDKKVQFAEPQQQQLEGPQQSFVQRHTNTLESILN